MPTKSRAKAGTSKAAAEKRKDPPFQMSDVGIILTNESTTDDLVRAADTLAKISLNAQGTMMLWLLRRLARIERRSAGRPQ